MLGVLNPKGHPDDDPDRRVPGTVVFWNTDVELHDSHHLVLSPTVSTPCYSWPKADTIQPTSDPEDPLNWPQWKKEVVLAVLCIASIIAAT